LDTHSTCDLWSSFFHIGEYGEGKWEIGGPQQKCVGCLDDHVGHVMFVQKLHQFHFGRI
jgi:hypothetical protein